MVLPLGCRGDVSDPRGNDNPTAPLKPGEAAPLIFSCDSSAQPDELALPRLSRMELQHTLQFAIVMAAPDDATAIWNGISSTFARYPDDRRTAAPGDLKGGYGRADQSIQQLQVDAIYATGNAIAQELTASSARMAAMMGDCATDASATNDRTCLERFIGRWGSRVMRSPLSQADITYYSDIAGSIPVDAAAVADVVAAVLNSPQTLYHVEHGADDTREISPLSAFELAARLSYQFWQAPPDDELWNAAQTGVLLDATAFQGQLDRLVRGQRARRSLDEFVAQWLRLDELPPLDTLNDNPVFRTFAGAELPPGSARDAMIEDVLASAFATVSSNGSVSDFLNDRRSYATDDYLAGIYRVPVWSGTGPAPLFSSGKRAGLLTRAAMLSTGTATTRPIHKGYLVRNAMLCQQVGAPPPNVSIVPPSPTGSQTTRQAVMLRTSSGTCGGCHLTSINPPGFLTESFDALGRERTEERLFDAQGNVFASLPVDTAAAPEVWPGDTRRLSDAVELTRVIDETKLFHSCIARQYFRFSQRRVESLSKDGCLLSSIETAARSGAPMAEVLKSVAVAPTFKSRRFQ